MRSSAILRRHLVLATLALSGVPARAGSFVATVLDADKQPVPGAVVFVSEIPGKSFAPPAQPYVMDQVGKEFFPSVLPIVVGGSVSFPNHDAIHHHVYSLSPTKTFELPLYKGRDAVPVKFPKVGVVKLGCEIHDWMRAVILVLQNPYFAVTDATGRALIDGVPAGSEVELAVFHERLVGSVDDTRKKIRLSADGRDTYQWTLRLKPPSPKRPRARDPRS